MEQLSLLEYTKPKFAVDFKGATFSASFDGNRLNGQQKRVHDCMIDGEWRNLREIENLTGDPGASIQARMRDFRNDEYLTQFFISESRRLPGADRSGIWQYRLLRRG